MGVFDKKGLSEQDMERSRKVKQCRLTGLLRAGTWQFGEDCARGESDKCKLTGEML